MNRLFNFIEDDELRRELEQTVVEQLSDSDITILTNVYIEPERAKNILQLFTYDGGDLYGGEVVVPDEETYEDPEMDFFRRQIEDMAQMIAKRVKAESKDWPKDNYCATCSRGWNNGEVNPDCPHNFPEEYADKMND